MPFMHVDGAGLFYEVAGSGEPALFLVHGFTCDHTDWRFQFQQLSQHHRTVACDLRGHGRSAGGLEACTMSAFGRDINCMRNELNLGQVVLIGHSMGCLAVLEAYLQCPDSIAGLVLVDGNKMEPGEARERTEKEKKAMEEVGLQEFNRRLFADMFIGQHANPWKEEIIERATRIDPQFARSHRSNTFTDWVPKHRDNGLSRVKVPILVLQSTAKDSGSKRRSLKKGDATAWLEIVRERSPSAEIEIIPGCGHFVMLEAPEIVSTRIGAFASKLK